MISPRSLPGASLVSSDSGAVSRIGFRRSKVGIAFSTLIDASLSPCSAETKAANAPLKAMKVPVVNAGGEPRRARRLHVIQRRENAERGEHRES